MAARRTATCGPQGQAWVAMGPTWVANSSRASGKRRRRKRAPRPRLLTTCARPCRRCRPSAPHGAQRLRPIESSWHATLSGTPVRPVTGPGGRQCGRHGTISLLTVHAFAHATSAPWLRMRSARSTAQNTRPQATTRACRSGTRPGNHRYAVTGSPWSQPLLLQRSHSNTAAQHPSPSGAGGRPSGPLPSPSAHAAAGAAMATSPQLSSSSESALLLGRRGSTGVVVPSPRPPEAGVSLYHHHYHAAPSPVQHVYLYDNLMVSSTQSLSQGGRGGRLSPSRSSITAQRVSFNTAGVLLGGGGGSGGALGAAASGGGGGASGSSSPFGDILNDAAAQLRERELTPPRAAAARGGGGAVAALPPSPLGGGALQPRRSEQQQQSQEGGGGGSALTSPSPAGGTGAAAAPAGRAADAGHALVEGGGGNSDGEGSERFFTPAAALPGVPSGGATPATAAPRTARGQLEERFYTPMPTVAAAAAAAGSAQKGVAAPSPVPWRPASSARIGQQGGGGEGEATAQGPAGGGGGGTPFADVLVQADIGGPEGLVAPAAPGVWQAEASAATGGARFCAHGPATTTLLRPLSLSLAQRSCFVFACAARMVQARGPAPPRHRPRFSCRPRPPRHTRPPTLPPTRRLRSSSSSRSPRTPPPPPPQPCPCPVPWRATTTTTPCCRRPPPKPTAQAAARATLLHPRRRRQSSSSSSSSSRAPWRRQYSRPLR